MCAPKKWWKNNKKDNLHNTQDGKKNNLYLILKWLPIVKENGLHLKKLASFSGQKIYIYIYISEYKQMTNNYQRKNLLM